MEEIFVSLMLGKKTLQIHHPTNLFPPPKHTLPCVKNLQRFSPEKSSTEENRKILQP